MFRAIDKWFAGYLRSVIGRPDNTGRQCHVLLCVADHFEPFGGGRNSSDAVSVVRRWVNEYPAACAGIGDAEGRPPRHTFFYPAEEYNGECLDLLAQLCARDFGEVEVHLHHRNDTRDGFRKKVTEFRDLLATKHGLLGRDAGGRPRYGFIHGNWALCNSRPDGDWCGVNEELGILSETGCYADFTFPSAPSPTQPRMVNSIYRATDTVGQPRACDRGTPIRVGGGEGNPGSLPILTGPLAPDWRRRKFGLVPRLENSAVTSVNPATTHRARVWMRQGIHVVGRPEWIFVKVHMHGASEGKGWHLAAGIHAAVRDVCRENGALPYFVTAREMFNIVRAAEDGKDGAPGHFRDYEVSPPGNRV